MFNAFWCIKLLFFQLFLPSQHGSPATVKQPECLLPAATVEEVTRDKCWLLLSTARARVILSILVVSFPRIILRHEVWIQASNIGRQGKARQGKAGQGRAGQGKARQGKATRRPVVFIKSICLKSAAWIVWIV